MSGSSDSDRAMTGDETKPVNSPEPLPGEPSAQPAAETEAPAQSRKAPIVGGAVAGAVAAVLVGLGIDASGWLDRPDAALTARIASLETQLPELRAGTGGLVQRVTALEQRPEPVEPDLAPLQQAVDGVRGEVVGLQPEIETLRDGLANQAKAAEMARAGLDQGIRELRETTSGFSLSLSEQRARIDALAAQRPDLQPLTDGLAAARSALGAQEGRLAELASRVGQLEDTLVAARASAAESARLAMALAELDRAVNAGEPLAAALQPFEPLASDPLIAAPLDQLRPSRAEAVPMVADLQARLVELRPEIIQSMRWGGGSDWLGRTAQNLAGLVDLQRVDSGEAALTAPLADAEQALAKGDVQAAVTAMQPVADAGNASAKGWVELARRRLDALAAVESLRTYLARHASAAP